MLSASLPEDLRPPTEEAVAVYQSEMPVVIVCLQKLVKTIIARSLGKKDTKMFGILSQGVMQSVRMVEPRGFGKSALNFARVSASVYVCCRLMTLAGFCKAGFEELGVSGLPFLQKLISKDRKKQLVWIGQELGKCMRDLYFLESRLQLQATLESVSGLPLFTIDLDEMMIRIFRLLVGLLDNR